jgi:hypothetical protein
MTVSSVCSKPTSCHSARQYKYRFRRLKNMTAGEWVYIDEECRRRAALGKESTVYLDGKPLAPERVARGRARIQKRVSASQISERAPKRHVDRISIRSPPHDNVDGEDTDHVSLDNQGLTQEEISAARARGLSKSPVPHAAPDIALTSSPDHGDQGDEYDQPDQAARTGEFSRGPIAYGSLTAGAETPDPTPSRGFIRSGDPRISMSIFEPWLGSGMCSSRAQDDTRSSSNMSPKEQ